MLGAVKRVAGLKLLQRAAIIEQIKKERGEAFGKYVHNRTLSIISPKKNPGDHHNLMHNRSLHRKNHFTKMNLFNWRFSA